MNNFNEFTKWFENKDDLIFRQGVYYQHVEMAGVISDVDGCLLVIISEDSYYKFYDNRIEYYFVNTLTDEKVFVGSLPVSGFSVNCDSAIISVGSQFVWFESLDEDEE